MWHDLLKRQIEEMRLRAGTLRERSIAADGSEPELVSEALEDLSTALEELRVSAEQLREQNEALQAAQLELAAQRRRYQELFDLAPDGYLVTDRRGTIEEANRAA